MKAMQFEIKGGDPQVVEIAKPVPRDNEVLVKVAAAAIDTGLETVIENHFDAMFLHSKKAPLYLGWHFSGIVEALGDKVTTLREGQDVFGFLQYSPDTTQGSFSEYIVVGEEDCAIKPAPVSFEEAAASTTEALTALQAIRDIGGLSNGKRILIVGAAGSVGSAGVQIAKQLGAHVTAVCRTKDVDKVMELGADECIDRSKVDPLKVKSKYDVIFDTPSACKASSYLSLLNKKGVYVQTLPTLGMLSGMFWTLFTSKKVRMVMAKSKQKDLELVGKWLADGHLKIAIDSTFKSHDMTKAMQRYADKSRNGRVVIQVKEGF